MSPQPELPEPAHHQLDSMLSRKFGKEIANYFSGSPLNRVSFLRTDHTFLSKALTHPSTSFLLFNSLAPLTNAAKSLAYVSYPDVRPLFKKAWNGDASGSGEGNPFLKSEEDHIKEFDSSKEKPTLLFLGLDERIKEDGVFEYGIYKGNAYFAVDITPKGDLETEANKLLEVVKTKGLVFEGNRMILSLSAAEAAIYAQGRALLDWNARNPYCAGCGQKTISVNSGTKRSCPPTDYANSTDASTPITRADCPTRHGISNLSFPRTDPTVIMAVVSHDNQRILLGRGKRFPPYWYSTLAGFCEPAESVEEAVRREVWEESGVLLGRVVIHSTQPWPYPANLMIGAIAQALPDGEEILLKHDPELEDAKWVSFDEVRKGLKVGTSGIGEGPSAEYTEGELRLPPRTAIANQLLTAVVNGFLGGEAKI